MLIVDINKTYSCDQIVQTKLLQVNVAKSSINWVASVTKSPKHKFVGMLRSHDNGSPIQVSGDSHGLKILFFYLEASNSTYRFDLSPLSLHASFCRFQFQLLDQSWKELMMGHTV